MPNSIGTAAVRSAGVLLHPTALGADGALGQSARRFVDWLAEAGFTYWQVLPLGPVEAALSPYWCASDSAFNPALIDWREATAFANLGAHHPERREFEAFRASQRWADDYALFATLQELQGGAPWWRWPREWRERQSAALQAVRAAHAAAIEQCIYQQCVAERQWRALRAYAAERGVRLFGDLPIYVAPNSVATWQSPEQFQLTPQGEPAALAGVPPDYFSADGQLWGNPLYDWAQAERDGFAFWRARVALQLSRFDLLRIDHFRGLESYWSVPAGAANARAGEWRAASGDAMLAALRRESPSLPLVAEDLGVITPAVDALRQRHGLPGMRVLQFGFDGAATNPHLPHNFEHATVVYTGTHDNDTALGWYRQLDAHTRRQVEFTLRSDLIPMPEALLRAALFSVAELAIVPAQDLIGAGSEARFNTPGTVGGNWRWQLPLERLDSALSHWCRALLHSSARLAG